MVSIIIYFCCKQKDVWVILSARMKHKKRAKQKNSSSQEKFAEGHVLGNLLTELESLESIWILKTFSHLFSMQWVKFTADEIPLALLSVPKS